MSSTSPSTRSSRNDRDASLDGRSLGPREFLSATDEGQACILSRGVAMSPERCRRGRVLMPKRSSAAGALALVLLLPSAGAAQRVAAGVLRSWSDVDGLPSPAGLVVELSGSGPLGFLLAYRRRTDGGTSRRSACEGLVPPGTRRSVPVLRRRGVPLRRGAAVGRAMRPRDPSLAAAVLSGRCASGYLSRAREVRGLPEGP